MKNNFKKLLLLPIFLVVFGWGFFAFSSEVLAKGELKVSGEPYRISHPAYYMLDKANGDANVINANNTRILLFEHNRGFSLDDGTGLNKPADTTWPSAPAGRETIWGDIAALKLCDLDNASLRSNPTDADLNGLNCYVAATSQVGFTTGTPNWAPRLAEYPKWSPIAGEENILYGMCLRNESYCTGLKGHLVKIDTDKNQGDAGWLTDVTNIYGDSVLDTTEVHSFTNTNSPSGTIEVLINSHYTNSYPSYFGAGKRVILTPSIQVIDYTVSPYPCQTVSWPQSIMAIHVGTGYLETGRYSGASDANCPANQSYDCVYDCSNINNYWQDYEGNAEDLSGFTWARIGENTYTPDWYIASNYNETTRYRSLIPFIELHQKINQVIFDEVTANANRTNHTIDVFTHQPLINRATAGEWSEGNTSYNSNRLINYSGIAHPTLSYDNTRIRFYGTNGRYSSMDKAVCNQYYAVRNANFKAACDAIGTNWEGNGVYIADLIPADDSPADVDGNGAVNIKDIQACIKVITGADLTYENQCRVLSAPDMTTNIKDIQVIIQKIIGE